jgi:uncharacterized membrane protein YgcG
LTLGALLLALPWANPAAGEPSLPPPPARYFNDGAGFVSAATASRLNEELAAYERRTGRQVVVAIFKRLPSASLEDFTVRTAQSWRVGRKGLDGGAVLFVFAEDRKLRLEVGYGLEATIPDAIADRILEEVIVPRLKSGSSDGALEEGVAAVIAAADGNWHPPRKLTDVPIPKDPGFHDDAGLFAERDRVRMREAVAAFTEETRCPMTVQVLNGGARTHSGDYGPELYAGRAYFRSHPPSRPDLTDEQRWQEILSQPAALFFVFVTARQPLKAEMSFYATTSCLPDAVVNGILVDVEPRFPLAPVQAVLAVPTLALQARRGVWSPPPLPTAEEYFRRADELREATNSDVERALVHAFAGQNLKWWGIVLALFMYLIYKVDFGSGGGTTWSSSGSSSSRSSSSSGGSSFSGGGGSFGGGGASGSW